LGWIDPPHAQNFENLKIQETKILNLNLRKFVGVKAREQKLSMKML
jgi:hypothetical protein